MLKSNDESNADSNDSNSKEVYMLTTLDNPFNPFTQFDQWYAYDEQQGYSTCSYIARVAYTSEELSEEDEAAAVLAAIDEIVDINVLGNYVKVTKDSWKDRSQSSPKPKTDD